MSRKDRPADRSRTVQPPDKPSSQYQQMHGLTQRRGQMDSEREAMPVERPRKSGADSGGGGEAGAGDGSEHATAASPAHGQARAPGTLHDSADDRQTATPSSKEKPADRKG